MKTIPYIIHGEVVASFPPEDPSNLSKLRYEYTVKATLPGNSVGLFYHAIKAESISGVDDYCESILRASTDNNGNGNVSSLSATELKQRSGDRCILAFLGGDTRLPIILGMLPHPLSSPLNPAAKTLLAEKASPQLRARYNGINIDIDETGQLIIQHNKAPEITPDKPLLLAVEKSDKSEMTTMSFLDAGIWEILDSQSQSITIDPDEKAITISNMGATDFTGEEIIISKADKLISISSSGEYELIVSGDVTEEIDGDRDIVIGGDLNEEISGDWTAEVKGGYDLTVTDSYTLTAADVEWEIESLTQTISGDYEAEAANISLTAQSEFTATESTGATLTLSGGKVTLGTSSAEVLSLLSDFMGVWLDNASAVGISSQGPVALHPAIIPVLTQLKTLLDSVKG